MHRRTRSATARARHGGGGMRFRLRGSDGCGSPEPLVLEVDGDNTLTVMELRQAVADKLGVGEEWPRIQMMARGKVLGEDEQSLAEAGVGASGDVDLLLALWEPFGCGKAESELGVLQRPDLIRAKTTLASMFNLSSFPVTAIQSAPRGDMLSLFSTFVESMAASCCVKLSGNETGAVSAADESERGEWKRGFRQRCAEPLRRMLVPVIPTFEQVDAMKHAVATLTNKSLSKGNPVVTWYAEYGCCIVANCVSSDAVVIELLGLDGWKFKVHGYEGERSAEACPESGVSLFNGFVHPEKYKKVIENIDSALKKAAELKGNERSAGLNTNGGHQKTPAFVHAKVVDVIRDIDGEVFDSESEPWSHAGSKDDGKQSISRPQGGMTDVGMHTDCRPRNTTWPLACAVIDRCFEAKGCKDFFRLAMASFKLWVAESFAAQLRPDVADKLHVDVAMDLLRSAADDAIELIDSGYDLRAFELRCALIRKAMEIAVASSSVEVASKFVISKQDVELSQKASCRNFSLKTPEAVNICATEKNMEHIKTSSEKNIGFSVILNVKTAAWKGLLQWFQRSEFASADARVENIILSLRTVESYCMQHSSSLYSSKSSKLSKSDIADIESLLDLYRTRAASFRESKVGELLMVSELLSLEVLTVWICTCLVHQAAAVYHPSLLRYAMPLSYKSLRHLVLSEKVAIDAAYNVSFYLRDESKQKIFSLQSQSDPTFAFAAEVAETVSDIKKALALDRAEMAKRESDHWNVILKTKERLRSLQEQLTTKREALALREQILNGETKYYTSSSPNADGSYSNFVRSEWRDANNACKSARGNVISLQNTITSTEKPPANVIHPLPESDHLAMQVLFFMFMPAELNSMARLCLASQSMLLPRSRKISVVGRDSTVDVDKLVEVETPRTCWLSFYNTHSSSKSGIGAKTHLSLHTSQEPPRGKFGPSTVSAYTTPRDGVFYPCSMARGNLVTAWRGGEFNLDERQCGPYNPFQERQKYTEVVANYFTENLSESDFALQWAMPQLGFELTTKERGNMALAKQAERPDWLNKMAFLEFGSMRAYPRQQLRRLCTSLAERNLPFGHPSTQKLLLQSLFHLGELFAESRKQFLVWQGDTNHGILDVLRNELLSLGQELRSKSRESDAVECLARIASYVAQISPECSEAEDSFARAALEWAQAIESELVSPDAEAAKDFAVEQDSRARLCKFYLMIVQSLVSITSQKSANGVERICSAMALADFRRLRGGKTDHDQAIERGFAGAARTQARRIYQFLEDINESPDILTKSVRSVLEQAPPNLSWSAFTNDGDVHCRTACFNAVSDEGHLYSINAYTGRILLDGLPLRRLPDSVISHNLFVKVFGNRNFDVAETCDGALLTARRVGSRSCFYSFYLHSEVTGTQGELAETLLVSELSEGEEEGQEDFKFELLDPARGSWADTLPTRLRLMHSHWYCRQLGTILLRPISFSEDGVSFIMKEGIASEWSCYRVPDHLSKCSWRALAVDEENRFDRLVFNDSSVVKVLRKLEDSQFIASYVKPSGEVAYELPRFDLSFREDKYQTRSKSDGTVFTDHSAIACDTFAGFDLCRSQQLRREEGGCLEYFSQYIVLQQRGTVFRKIVIPQGEVTICPKTSNVSIVGGKMCTDRREWHSFDIHPRFGRLVAAGTPGRLQIAAVFAASSSLLPMWSGYTGFEIAMQLIRECWTNVPLSKTSWQHLEQIIDHGKKCPGLVLLCNDLAVTSSRLEALYPKSILRFDLLKKGYCTAAAAYVSEKRRSRFQKRAELFPQEEERCFGYVIGRASSRPTLQRQDVEKLSTAYEQNLIAVYEESEQRLKGLFSVLAPTPPLKPPCLHAASEASETLAKRFVEDLEKSVSVYKSLRNSKLRHSPEIRAGIFKEIHRSVLSARVSVQSGIIELVHLATSDISFCIARLAAVAVSSTTLQDMCRCAFEPEKTLHYLNPTLSVESAQYVRKLVLIWMQLCVLEDKLNRLLRYSPQQSYETLRDLSSVRVWDVQENPMWLVFEVEQRLQIRPVQHLIAQHLLNDCDGNMTQLNVGLGKTRVIVPMLIMSCLRNAKERQRRGLGAARVYFLPQLLGEGYDYLHSCLTGSLLNIPLSRLPFNRDARLENETGSRLVTAICDTLATCQNSGALILSPQDTLSLALKTSERRLLGIPSDETLKRLQSMVVDENWFSILDESDSILDHKGQLVYAMGTWMNLPQGPTRFQAVFEVLEALHGANVATILSDKHIASKTKSKHPGSVDEVYLIGGPKLNKRRADLRKLIAEAIIAKKVDGWKWMAESAWKSAVIDLVCSPESGFEKYEEQLSSLRNTRRHQVLALRAMLAFEVLESCLLKRHRVAYGINRRSDRRVAVPFRSSETPATRSEFAHSDAQIVYTTLSYAYDGLTEGELQEALARLAQKGTSARSHEYNSWIHLSKPGLPENELRLIDKEQKVDPTSQTQFKILYAAFRKNFRTVCFFLQECVLPVETMTFPQQMRTTSWWLSDRKQIVGFSGTDDSKRLLPLHVKQTQPDAEEILATNGEMCCRIVESEVDTGWDSVNCNEGGKIWQNLIDHCVDQGAVALIDCGAILTGARMEEVAKYSNKVLIDRNEKLKGVVFFSNTKQDWLVSNSKGQVYVFNSSSK